jgi:hypothetical protein
MRVVIYRTTFRISALGISFSNYLLSPSPRFTSLHVSCNYRKRILSIRAARHSSHRVSFFYYGEKYIYILIINNSFRCAQCIFYFLFFHKTSVSIIIAQRLRSYFIYLRPFHRNVYVYISSVTCTSIPYRTYYIFSRLAIYFMPPLV